MPPFRFVSARLTKNTESCRNFVSESGSVHVLRSSSCVARSETRLYDVFYGRLPGQVELPVYPVGLAHSSSLKTHPAKREAKQGKQARSCIREGETCRSSRYETVKHWLCTLNKTNRLDFVMMSYVFTCA